MQTQRTKAATPSAVPLATADDAPPWFIFTSTGQGFCVQGESLTQAVSAWKKAKHRGVGEIVGVIRGAAAMEVMGRVMPTPVFGVIACVAQPDEKAKSGPKSTGGVA